MSSLVSETGFDPMMLESQWREDLLARMARSSLTPSPHRQMFEHAALQLLPSGLRQHIDVVSGHDAERRHEEIEIGLLMLAVLYKSLLVDTHFQAKDAQ